MSPPRPGLTMHMCICAFILLKNLASAHQPDFSSKVLKTVLPVPNMYGSDFQIFTQLPAEDNGC